YLGPLSRDQETVRARLDPYDTVISLGSDFLRMSVYSEVEPLPPHMSVIQIGLNDWEMGKTYPAEIAVRADVNETLHVLTPLVAELGGRRSASAPRTASPRFPDATGRPTGRHALTSPSLKQPCARSILNG